MRFPFVRLPCDREKLAVLDGPQVVDAIVQRRKAIRYHRDQVGDDRCFFDDWRVWLFLDDTRPMPCYTLVTGLAQCHRFYEYRRAEEVDPPSPDAIIDPSKWDDDLASMDYNGLLDELVRIQCAIRAHRDWIDSLENDRKLYAVPPEKVVGDYRLPPKEEFLGEAKAPSAGCPSFFLSHEGHDSAKCDWSVWGEFCPGKQQPAA